MGAALLRKPTKLAKMVNAIARESPLPVTVKIRTGESERKINAPRVVNLLQRAGAAVVTVHGRTMEQRRVMQCWFFAPILAAVRALSSVFGNEH